MCVSIRQARFRAPARGEVSRLPAMIQLNREVSVQRVNAHLQLNHRLYSRNSS